jgi:thiol-disulfide isomerase/thioredoxin
LLSGEGILQRVLLATLIVLSSSLWPSRAFAGSDKPASLSLRDMQGARVKLSDLKGKIVVLNFWATWCEPCNAEMPMLVKTAASYSGRGVAFLGVSVDAPETQGKVAAYVRKLEITYPIWLGATDDDRKKMQAGNVVPATVFLDANGVVRARILGQMRPGEIEERVDWLLRNMQGNPPEALVKHLEAK